MEFSGNNTLGRDLIVKNVSKWFEVHFFGREDKNSEQEIMAGFYKGICRVLQKMRFYQEENERIKFRLAIGCYYDKSVMKEDNNEIELKHLCSKWISHGTSADNTANLTYSCIKKALPFCRDNTDAYIVLRDTDNESKNVGGIQIESGVFFLELGETKRICNDLLKKGFIIAECLNENIVVLYTYTKENGNKSYLLKFDLSDIDQNTPYVVTGVFDPENISQRFWRDVFERAERNCHGTICLIVGPKFKLEKLKDNLTNDPLPINDVALFPNQNEKKDRESMQLFYSMLNYDGFTIISTSGKVLSYNNICKLDGNSPEGGSRHAAFDKMKSWDPIGLDLVAIYFQSQEGEIVFYVYSRDYFKQKGYGNKELPYVDDSVFLLANESNIIIESVKKVQNAIKEDFYSVNDAEKQNYLNVSYAVQALQKAHIEFYNYYNEPSAANKLLSFFKNSAWNELFCGSFAQDKRYLKLRKDTINAVISCIIGNSYGFSKDAQSILENILELIPEQWYKEYFDKELFLDEYLLVDLTCEKPYHRWITVIKEKLKIYINEESFSKYTLDAFIYARMIMEESDT